MPTNKGLELLAFVRGLSPSTADRYYQSVGIPTGTAATLALMFGSVTDYLAEPDNHVVAETILDDFGKVQGLVEHGPGLIIRAHHHFGIPLDESVALQELGLRLLLDHPYAFAFARSRLLMNGAGTTTGLFNLGVNNVTIDTENLLAFQEAVRERFRGEGKGPYVSVRHYVEQGETIVLVERGHYVEIKPFWDEEKIAVSPRRPAIEDVLTFDSATAELRIRSSLQKDREAYLRLFCLHIVGDGRIADMALRRRVFSLEPFQKQTFSFSGRGAVRAVVFVGARVRIFGASNLVAWFSADDFRSSLKYDLGGLSLEGMELLAVKLRFHLSPPGERPTKLTLLIQPPAETDAGERRHINLVMDYLKEQGVRIAC